LQLIDLLCASLDQEVNFTRDIAFQATDRFKLRVPIGKTLLDAGLGSRIDAEASNRDDM